MADMGILFTILSPHQAGRFRRIGQGEWQSVNDSSLDTTQACACRLPSGKSINVFFYDQALSHELSFGGLLKDGETFSKTLLGRLAECEERSRLLCVASDGEIFGHHHRFGDMALAFCLDRIEREKSFSLTNCAEYLEKFPPENEVEIVEKSSWSCPHGVERWRKNCGCRTGSHPEWTQEWRAPLRETLDWLRGRLDVFFEKRMEGCFKDPWQARDAFISVIQDRTSDNVEAFFSRNTERQLSPEEKGNALKWMEAQRSAMLMYTSCGWFFEDISGIETVQNLRYAARAMQLSREAGGEDIEPEFIRRLERARCNAPEYRDGTDIYNREIKPDVLDPCRVGAHYTAFSPFEEYPDVLKKGSYSFRGEQKEVVMRERDRLSFGKMVLSSNITREEAELFYTCLLFEENNLLTGVVENTEKKAMPTKLGVIKQVFESGDIPATIRLLKETFHEHLYSPQHLLKDVEKEVLRKIVELSQKEMAESSRRIFMAFYPLMQEGQKLFPLPDLVLAAFAYALNEDFRRLLEGKEPDGDLIRKYVSELSLWSLRPDRENLRHLLKGKIERVLEDLFHEPLDLSLWRLMDNLIWAIEELSLDVDLWRSQNLFFRLCRHLREETPESEEWMTLAKRTGEFLKVKCP